MTALETVQALLAFDAPRPLKFGEIRYVKEKEPKLVPAPTTTEQVTETVIPTVISTGHTEPKDPIYTTVTPASAMVTANVTTTTTRAHPTSDAPRPDSATYTIRPQFLKVAMSLCIFVFIFSS